MPICTDKPRLFKVPTKLLIPCPPELPPHQCKVMPLGVILSPDVVRGGDNFIIVESVHKLSPESVEPEPYLVKALLANFTRSSSALTPAPSILSSKYLTASTTSVRVL